MSSGDTTHLASAWNAQCNFLITSDEHFISNTKEMIKNLGLNIEIITPDKFLKKYK